MPVYDDEKTTDDQLRDITGINAADEKAIDAHAEEGMDQGNIAAAEEASTSANSSSAADAKEKNAVDDKLGSGYTGDPDKPATQNTKGQSRRRRGVLAGILVTGAIGAGSFGLLSAPNLIVNQLRELLLGKVSELQTHQQRRYRRKKIARVSDMFSRDGRRGGKIMAEMERRGYSFAFDPADRNKMIGICIGVRGNCGPDPRTGSYISGDDIGDHLDEYLEVHHPLRTSRWKTKRMNAFYDRYKVSRRSPVQRVDGDIEDPDVEINKRIAGQVVGEEPVNDTKPLGATEEETVEESSRRNGSNSLANGDGIELEDLKQKLRDGVPLDELSEDERLFLQSASRIDQEVVDLMTRSINSDTFFNSSVRGLKSFGSSTDLLDRVCIGRNRLRAIQFAARNYRALSLMRYTSEFIKASDSARTGEVDPKLMNSLFKRVTAVDSNGNSIGGSPGFSYMLKKKFSKSDNEAKRGNVGVDGKLTGVAGALDSSLSNIPGTSRGSCRVIQNPGFQVGVAVVEVAAAIFSGGSSAGVSTAAKTTVSSAVKQSLQRVLTKQVAKQVLRSAATQVAIEITFEGALSLLEAYSEKSAQLNFSGQEKGGELGDILVAGAGTMNKQRGLEGGMVPATAEQYAAAQQSYIAYKKQEIASQGFFERVFDTSNMDSLAFKGLTNLSTMPLSMNSMFARLSNFFTSIARLPAQHITLLATGQVGAQSNDEIAFDVYEVNGEKLATDPAGNLLPIMRTDIENIDPIENIQWLKNSGDINAAEPYEPKSDRFKDHIESCVGGDNVDTLTTMDNGDDHDCLAKKSITKRFKAHLAYIDLLDGLDAALFPEEISSTSGSGAAPSGSNPGGAIIGDPYSDTTNVPCAPGTKDIGLQDAYVNGRLFKSRMCSVSNMPSSGQADNPGGSFSTPGADGHAIVNSRVSGAWYQLVEDAKAAGINFSVISSFRSMPHQQSLWRSNPNPKLVARPGHSSHQAGVALDFSNMSGKKSGASCSNRATNGGRGYQWLRENAGRYGFKQYAAEAWHWDALPSENRCS